MAEGGGRERGGKLSVRPRVRTRLPALPSHRLICRFPQFLPLLFLHLEYSILLSPSL